MRIHSRPCLAGIPALLAVLVLPLAIPAQAETPADIAARLEALARQADPAFAGFSAIRGATFFTATQDGEWSCATCHTAKPVSNGRHVKTGKAIAPLAPAANAERFTSAATVDKWFRRNCNDVLGRECTAREKGDVLAWLASLEYPE